MSSSQCKWCSSEEREKARSDTSGFPKSTCFSTWKTFFGTQKQHNDLTENVLVLICNVDPENDVINVKNLKFDLSIEKDADKKTKIEAKLNYFVDMEEISPSVFSTKIKSATQLTADELQYKGMHDNLNIKFHIPVAAYKDEKGKNIFKLIKGEKAKQPSIYFNGLVTRNTGAKWGFLLSTSESASGYRVAENNENFLVKRKGATDFVVQRIAKNFEDIEFWKVKKEGVAEEFMPLVCLKIETDSETFFKRSLAGDVVKFNEFYNEKSDWQLARLIIV